MRKMTGDIWHPQWFVIRAQKSLFGVEKPQLRAGTHWDKYFWSKSRRFASKNHKWGLGPIEAS